ncbi:sigma-70 family RNA polymerase sigma factor [Acidisphaera sp. L21]|jgi:RNA polymerase sigma factor (sigma-70 family)|uniref:sigma-70 family RNA polymerase sigma factor n=1 Tax=Acidisphaera sp. L21 TaxID=1641851 RepID=UPI0020B1377D|nr:sigma-70 family RNA polymerase sigma factor [Acidisphaera sp. L21]
MKPDDPRFGNNGWADLMIAAQAGDAAAYRRLLMALDRWLGRYFTRRLPSATVEDTVQDTLLAIHEKRHTYDPARPFEPWLAAIARYKWIDRLRSMHTKPTVTLTDDIAIGDHGDAVSSAWSLERLLRELKPAQSDAIRLVKLQGLSVEEAADITGQSPSLVKVNIHRGLGRLRTLVHGRADDE